MPLIRPFTFIETGLGIGRAALMIDNFIKPLGGHAFTMLAGVSGTPSAFVPGRLGHQWMAVRTDSKKKATTLDDLAGRVHVPNRVRGEGLRYRRAGHDDRCHRRACFERSNLESRRSVDGRRTKMKRVKQILTITLNPTIDMSSSVDNVFPEHKLRCGSAFYEPGGGGLNVARAIHQLGGNARALHFCGGPTGDILRALLE